MGWLKELVDAGLTSRDLSLAWLSRRMFPLRARSYKMCFYSGPRDPTRVSMEVAPLESLQRWAARIITDKVGQNWRFRVKPFTRSERAPEVSNSSCSFGLSLVCPTGCHLIRLACCAALRASKG